MSDSIPATDSPTSANEQVVPDQAPVNPVRRVVLVAIAMSAVLFALYVLTDRYTPYSDAARVSGFVVPIIPDVSGYLVEVNVEVNQIVEGGEVLARIDPSRYQLAVDAATAALESAGQQLGAGIAEVVTAQANLTEAQANLDNVRIQAGRILQVEKKGVVSRADADRARAELAQTEARAVGARAEVDRVKEQLGSAGQDNPRIRGAVTELRRAQLDLARTELRAPSLGGVTNLQVDIGHYVAAGKPIMTFVSANDVWIEAQMRENSLGNIKPGDRAEILLDIAPGHIFEGTVASVGYGVSDSSSSRLGDLPTLSPPKSWLRDAQRFPVIIRFADDEARGLRRVGGQADVVVYTGEHPVPNVVGWALIRLANFLSYVY